MKEALFQVGQKAVIVNARDEVLITVQDDKYHPGQLLYDFPGGRIDNGETDMDQALKREMREELQVEIDVHELLTLSVDLVPKKDRPPVALATYRCSIVSGEPKPSEEDDVHGFEWANIDKLISVPKPRYSKELIEEIKRKLDLR